MPWWEIFGEDSETTEAEDIGDKEGVMEKNQRLYRRDREGALWEGGKEGAGFRDSECWDKLDMAGGRLQGRKRTLETGSLPL